MESAALRHFTFARYRLTIEALDPLILPDYKGSTFRGGFGHAFKTVSCATPCRACQECSLKETCAYAYVFETPPPGDTAIMRKYPSAPHPFVLIPPTEGQNEYQRGDELIFFLTLIGRGIEYLPYFIYTFDELGGRGIGRGRGKYQLSSVESQDADGEWVLIYHVKDRILRRPSFRLVPGIQDGSSENCSITIGLETPVRIVYRGRLSKELDFHIIIRNLLRRASLLSYFHCGRDMSGFDFRRLIDRAETVRRTKSKLTWYDWERYSSRQKRRVQMGGYIGEVTFEGLIGPFMPLLRLGEAIHMGKGTSFGLGKFKILEVS